jgi:uncharacterized membrane protein
MLKFIKNQLGYLFSGLVFLLPVTVIVWILYIAFNALEGWGRDFLELIIPNQFVFNGSGLILIAILLYLIGVLLKRKWFTRLLSKIPFMGALFGGKNGEMMTVEKLKNLTPCLFFSSETCRKYGWILYEEKVEFGGEIFEGDVKIYVPNFPTMVFGEVCSLPKKNVMVLGNTYDEVINFVLSTKEPENRKYLPWGEEGKKEFKERLARFNVIIK